MYQNVTNLECPKMAHAQYADNRAVKLDEWSILVHFENQMEKNIPMTM